MRVFLRSRLGLKLLLSYLAVTLVCLGVLALAVNLAAPRAFARHMLGMPAMPGMEGMMTPGRGQGGMMSGFYRNFRQAVGEALGWAVGAGALAAGLAAMIFARQISAPVQALKDASQRIAEGNFSARVRLSAGKSPGELDELDQLALSFNQMASRLEQTENLRRQLIGDVAHELRTPLTTIKGSMEGLIDGVLPGDVETYEQIYREAERLSRLVDDLQELSRVEAGAYELNRRAVAVETLVRATEASLRRQFEEKGVALTVKLSAGLPPVLADELRIGQVLINLLGNALQYTPSGGQVEIRARAIGQAVRFEIADTGIGIAAEHLEHIFDRFYRVDKSRSRVGGGSGIGLTIARYLVEAHGGKIWAESPGQNAGSTFYFTLPVAGGRSAHTPAG